MSKTIQQVADFHNLFEHPIGKLNELEPLKVRQLRIKLLFEEVRELAEAGDVMGTFKDLSDAVSGDENLIAVIDGDNVNKVEELDAACDIQYVLNGKLVTSGLHEVFDEAFERVHQNNMNKAHTLKEEAEVTVSQNVGSTIKEKNGLFLVVRADGKLIKPHNHKKVSLSNLIPA